MSHTPDSGGGTERQLPQRRYPGRNPGWVAWFLALLTLSWSCMPPAAIAGPIPSGLGSDTGQRKDDIRRIERRLQDERLVSALAAAGVTPNDVRRALPRLTDHEVHVLAERMEDVKTGEGHGIVIGILVAVALVLLIIFLIQRI